MSNDTDKNFKFATSLIKIITLVIALMMIVVSRYAFIFFAAAMLPTLFAIFFDKNHHKCLSATICSFNLIGVLPYLVRMWNVNSIDYIAKQVLADINTWMIIYGAAFLGQLLYASMPLLVVKLYTTKIQIQSSNIQKQHRELCKEWGIDIK